MFLADSEMFPNQGPLEQTRLTVMIGGARHPELVEEGASEDHLSSIAIDAVKKLMGVSADPDSVSVHMCRNAICQMYVGHNALADEITSVASLLNPHFRIACNAIGGVSINDCIRTAKREAENFIESLASPHARVRTQPPTTPFTSATFS